jgi:erythromycin esterase
MALLEGKSMRTGTLTGMLGLAAFFVALSMVFVAAPAAKGANSGSVDSTHSDELQTWISRHAVAVRSIDASDDDFTDLEPLGRAIGSTRVVQLGEPSHGAGSAFAAKARITKFLHQRLGFDVLIWESGLYDVALAQAGMRSGDDAVTAAGRGIFTLWSAASEVRPLFEYVKASQATLRPLEMAGFDMQVTADGTTERYAHDLRAFAGAPWDPALRMQCVSLADQAIAARERLFSSSFANPRDLESLTAATQQLRQIMGARSSDFDAVRSGLETSFMMHTIEDMRADAAMRFESAHSPPTTPERESRRDALNAMNLRWLLEEKYAGRKVLVWAHNVHVMNAYYARGFHDVHLEPHPGDMKPMGLFLREWLGDKVYTLGITAFQGEEGFAVGGPVSPIAPAPDGSFEASLHTLGYPYAFVDFRASKKDRRNPMRAAQTIRIPKFESHTIPDVGHIYDGIFFIDRMSPATRLSGHSGPSQ